MTSVVDAPVPPADAAATSPPSAAIAPRGGNAPTVYRRHGWWRTCLFPLITGMLLLVAFIIPAVFVHLVTGGVDPSPVLEDMLLALPLMSSTTGGSTGVPTRCGVCYDMMRAAEVSVLAPTSKEGNQDVSSLLLDNKKRRNAYLLTVEGSVCPSSVHFGTGSGEGGATAAGGHSYAAASRLHGKHFGRTQPTLKGKHTSGAGTSGNDDEQRKKVAPWNCTKFFRQNRDAIAEHLIGVAAASMHLKSNPTPVAPAKAKATARQRGCSLLAPLVPSIAAHVAQRQALAAGTEAATASSSQKGTEDSTSVAPLWCGAQQQLFADIGTGPVCSRLCEESMPWIDRTFVEVLRFIARHREVQLLCVCVREMWGVVLLLGLESGVIVLLLQLKGVHWSLQVSIAEALSLRKSPPPALSPAASAPGQSTGGQTAVGQTKQSVHKGRK